MTHYVSFWTQKFLKLPNLCSNGFVLFLLNSYIIQSMFKLFFSIGGTRNWGNVSVSRPRNRPISSVSGARILTITWARNWQNVSVSGPRNCSNGQHSIWPKKLMLWVCFRGQKLGFWARDTLWCPKTSLVHSPSPGEDWSANDIPRGHMPNRCLLQTCPSLVMGNVILSRSIYIYFKSKKKLSHWKPGFSDPIGIWGEIAIYVRKWTFTIKVWQENSF